MILNDIKALFSKYPKAEGVVRAALGIEEETAKIKLGASAQLENGTTVYTSADEWAVGVDVFTYDEESDTATPAPDGEHKLADGTTIKVEGGIVTEIMPAEEAPEQLSAEQIEALIKKLAEQAEQIEASATEKADLETKVTALSSEVSGLKAEIAKLSKQPAAVSVKQATAKPQAVKPVEVDMSKLNPTQRMFLAIQERKSQFKTA